MTRQDQAIKYGSSLTLLFVLLWCNILPTPGLSTEIREQIVPCLPFNLLVAFGSYCLWELGMGILTFGECESAYDDLMKEVAMAADDLRSKGVSVD